MSQNKKLNPIYFLVWSAFILMGCFAFYTGWQHHQPWAMGMAVIGILGFTVMIILAVKHNKKVTRSAESS